MKNTKTILLSALLTVSLLPCASAEQKSVTLKDGSVIKGELLKYENGVYTVKNDNLGELMLPDTNVVSVSSTSLAPAAASATATTMPHTQGAGQGVDIASALGGGALSSQVQSMQAQMTSNPEVMQAVMAMAEDPEISAMVSDPAFVATLTAALQGGNVNSVANDPRIQKMMANPKMQAIIQQMGGTVPSQ